jgi:diaminobutyrate-2-oxoglutarate transaminase
LQAACFKAGLVVELGGRNGAVVRLLPPLTITAEQVEAVCNVLRKACAQVAAHGRAAGMVAHA